MGNFNPLIGLFDRDLNIASAPTPALQAYIYRFHLVTIHSRSSRIIRSCSNRSSNRTVFPVAYLRPILARRSLQYFFP
jgi:hypothetical protein